MPTNLSCDWSTRFMKVILLGLSLVRTSLQYRCVVTGLQYKHTAVQQITSEVCVGSVKLYSSAQLCTKKYIPSVQDVYISTEYLYMNLYI